MKPCGNCLSLRIDITNTGEASAFCLKYQVWLRGGTWFEQAYSETPGIVRCEECQAKLERALDELRVATTVKYRFVEASLVEDPYVPTFMRPVAPEPPRPAIALPPPRPLKPVLLRPPLVSPACLDQDDAMTLGMVISSVVPFILDPDTDPEP